MNRPKTLVRYPRKALRLVGLMAVLFCHPLVAAPLTVTIEIKDHLFQPSEIVIPADTKVKLIINNLDPTPEEFESYELNREKVINGSSKAVIFIGPVPAGEYPFFGEFYPKTAQGRILVE